MLEGAQVCVLDLAVLDFDDGVAAVAKGARID